MEVKRVWFNHWFSTAYQIIDLMKRDDRYHFFVIGTNENENAVYKNMCDEWFQEPKLSEEEYLRYALDFCVEHDVDIFVPRRNMALISENGELFRKLGIKVLAERDINKLKTLQDKKYTYELFTELGIGNVPDYRIVNTAAQFEEAYHSLKSKENKICMKYVRDEGAVSFRVIEEGNKISGGQKLTYENAVKSLKEKETFADLMVMPYLSGREVSVDCLNTLHGLIAIPRFKLSGRVQVIRFDEEIMEACKQFFKKYGIFGPCNIQFRYEGEVPYLLEINTRMSGGIQLACCGAGVNIPNIAVNQLLGIQKEWMVDEDRVNGTKIAHIETPVIVR